MKMIYNFHGRIFVAITFQTRSICQIIQNNLYFPNLDHVEDELSICIT